MNINNLTKNVLVVTAVASLLLVAQNAHASCGLVFNSGMGNSIDFGPLMRDQISQEKQLMVNNNGEDVGTLEVRGTDWTANAMSHIAVGYTTYAVGNDTHTDPSGLTSYAQKSVLTSSDVFMGVLPPGSSNNTSWQLKAVLQNLPFNGVLSQTITFTISC